MSLGVSLGVLSSKPSGDFASKMWSSYTQLNPGVYSEAVATEFKRRMKPDYVENLVPNGGGLNATDWIDTNSDGLADGFTVINAPTATIETVLCPRGQRITRAGGNAFPSIQTAAGAVSLGVSYTITIRWYSSMAANGVSPGVRVLSNAAPSSYFLTGAANQWNEQTFTYNLQDATYLSVGMSGAIVGDFLIVDSITVSPTISKNYFNTFGPSGLNKTTADWIGIMVTSSATTARTITKTGATLKWNLDGTIITQNNLPAYTKGANAGIITFTSTDGFAGVATFDCSSSTLTHLSGLYGFTILYNFYCNSNQLTSLPTYKWTNLVNFQCYNNQLTSIGNFGTKNISSDGENFNKYSTAMVDSRLAYYNAMFAVTPPIKNLTLNLSGATMGIPTGAGSNTDLLGVLAKFTAAGFTATIIVRTS